MAQDIQISGQTYENVPSVEMPTPNGNTASFTEISDSTVSADTLADGVVAYSSDGTRLTGTMTENGLFRVKAHTDSSLEKTSSGDVVLDDCTFSEILEKYAKGLTPVLVLSDRSIQADSAWQIYVCDFANTFNSDISGEVVSFRFVKQFKNKRCLISIYSSGQHTFMTLSSNVQGSSLSDGSVTETKLSNEVQAKLNSSSSVDLSNYATKDELADKLDTSVASATYAPQAEFDEFVSTMQTELESTLNNVFASKQDELTNGSVTENLLSTNVQTKLNNTYLIYAQFVSDDEGNDTIALDDGYSYSTIHENYSNGKVLRMIAYIKEDSDYLHYDLHDVRFNSSSGEDHSCFYFMSTGDMGNVTVTINDDNSAELTIDEIKVSFSDKDLEDSIGGHAIKSGAVSEGHLDSSVREKLNDRCGVYYIKLNAVVADDLTFSSATYIDGFSYEIAKQKYDEGKILRCLIVADISSSFKEKIEVPFTYAMGDGPSFTFQSTIHTTDTQVTLRPDGTIYIHLQQYNYQRELTDGSIYEGMLSSSIQDKLNSAVSGSNAYFVRINWNSSTISGSYIGDCSYAQALSAYNSGKNLLLLIEQTNSQKHSKFLATHFEYNATNGDLIFTETSLPFDRSMTLKNDNTIQMGLVVNAVFQELNDKTLANGRITKDMLSDELKAELGLS